MQFLMFVCRDPEIPFGPEDRASIGSKVQAWVAEMEQRGVRVLGEVLEPVDEGTRVRVRDGETLVDAGAQPQAGIAPSGFNLLRCADLEEAIEVSAKHPVARFGLIELRPIAEG
jgi:hypothetical protein